jgi:hypothetical protein
MSGPTRSCVGAAKGHWRRQAGAGLSGSVSEICWSGVANSCFSMASSLAISDFSFVSFSLKRVFFSSIVSDRSCRSAVSSCASQGRDCQRPLSPICLRYVRPARWMGPIRSPVDSLAEILEIELEAHLVVLPSHPVDSSGSLTFERVEGCPEHIDVDVVEKRGESLLLPLPCGLPYAVQRLGHARPVLSPVHALLTRVPLGPCPLLRRLRRRWPGFVQRLPSCRVGGGGAFALPPSARSNGSCGFPASRFPVWTPRRRQEHSDARHQADQTYESHFRHQPSDRILAVSDIPPSLGYE